MLERMDPELADDLELACHDALRGDPPGPLVAARLQRACLEVLRARGFDGAQVDARSDRRGTVVTIRLPTPERRVEHIVLRLG